VTRRRDPVATCRDPWRRDGRGASTISGGDEAVSRTGWALAGVGVVVVAVAAKKAKKKGSAVEEVPAGPKPIEGVGTALPS
jgi:hypothetical protein